MIGLLGYAGILFVSLHLGKGGGESTGSNVVLSTMEHLTSQPLDIFPINWATVGKAAIFGLLAPLLAHSEYLKRRDLRPSEENGSAHWNENLKRFYNTYAETTVKLPLGLGTILSALERTLSKIPLLGSLYKSLYKKLCRRFCGPDKKPCSQNMIFTKEIYMTMNTRKTRRNNNILVIGGSGSGKSATRFCVNQAKHRHIPCMAGGWRTDNAKDEMRA